MRWSSSFRKAHKRTLQVVKLSIQYNIHTRYLPKCLDIWKTKTNPEKKEERNFQLQANIVTSGNNRDC